MNPEGIPGLPPRWTGDLAAGRLVIFWLSGRFDRRQAARAARALTARAEAELAERGGGDRRPLRFSRTATGGLAGLALARAFPVGLDAEAAQPVRPGDPGLAMALHPDEMGLPMEGDDFLWLWTRKEAVLKCLGTGLALDPRALATGGRAEGWRRIPVPWGGEASVRSVAAPRGVPAAVAVFGAPLEIAAFSLD